MAILTTWNSTVFSIPEANDAPDWGSSASAFLQSLANNAVSLNSSQTLTNKIFITPTITGTAALSALKVTPQVAPTGPNAVGDIFVGTGGIPKVCTAAGSPGTFTGVSLTVAMASNAPAATLSIPDSAATVVNFSTSDFITGGTVTTGAAWVYTVPMNGQYAVSASVNFQGLPASVDMILQVRKNALTAVRMNRQITTASGAQNGIAGSTVIDCAAGDTLQVLIFQTSGGARTIEAGRISINRV